MFRDANVPNVAVTVLWQNELWKRRTRRDRLTYSEDDEKGNHVVLIRADLFTNLVKSHLEPR